MTILVIGCMLRHPVVVIAQVVDILLAAMAGSWRDVPRPEPGPSSAVTVAPPASPAVIPERTAGGEPSEERVQAS